MIVTTVMGDTEIVMEITTKGPETCTANTIGPHVPTGAMIASTAGSIEITTIFTMTGVLTMGATTAGSTGAGTKGDLVGGMAIRTGMVGGITRDGMTTVMAIVPPGVGNDPPVLGTSSPSVSKE